MVFYLFPEQRLRLLGFWWTIQKRRYTETIHKGWPANSASGPAVALAPWFFGSKIRVWQKTLIPYTEAIICNGKTKQRVWRTPQNDEQNLFVLLFHKNLTQESYTRTLHKNLTQEPKQRNLPEEPTKGAYQRNLPKEPNRGTDQRNLPGDFLNRLISHLEFQTPSVRVFCWDNLLKTFLRFSNHTLVVTSLPTVTLFRSPEGLYRKNTIGFAESE